MEDSKISQESMTECRLCGHKAIYAFSKSLVSEFSVNYYECENCQSLQTEVPHWLDKVYSDCLDKYDVMSVSRTSESLAMVVALWKILLPNNAKLLDFGGGSGLLVRQLRDRGINTRLSDKYGTNIFAQGFEDSEKMEYDMVVCFEVFEHLSHPSKTIQDIMSKNPKTVVIGTCLWKKQGQNWFYLCPETGQHIFFFSEKAMEYIASEYNMNYYSFRRGSLTVLSNDTISPLKLLVLKIILKRPFLKILRVLLLIADIGTEKNQRKDREFLLKND